jgi:hypothetical protein
MIAAASAAAIPPLMLVSSLISASYRPSAARPSTAGRLTLYFKAKLALCYKVKPPAAKVCAAK